MKTDIHAIIEMLQTDPMGISTKFGVPLRTVYGWCKGNRTPPDYVINMMLNIILLERRSKINGNEEKELGSGMAGNIKGIKEVSKESKSEISKT